MRALRLSAGCDRRRVRNAGEKPLSQVRHGDTSTDLQGCISRFCFMPMNDSCVTLAQQWLVIQGKATLSEILNRSSL